MISEFHLGDRVTYVPGHAKAGGLDHPDCERGTVVAVRADMIFVKFDNTVVRHGWDGTTPMACRPTDLVNHGGPDIFPATLERDHRLIKLSLTITDEVFAALLSVLEYGAGASPHSNMLKERLLEARHAALVREAKR